MGRDVCVEECSVIFDKVEMFIILNLFNVKSFCKSKFFFMYLSMLKLRIWICKKLYWWIYMVL